jgi:hypothetical protein
MLNVDLLEIAMTENVTNRLLAQLLLTTSPDPMPRWLQPYLTSLAGSSRSREAPLDHSGSNV